MDSIRKDFPFLNNHNPITFLDSAASSQKPKCVIDKLVTFYSHQYANIHRGIYDLSSKATYEYEKVRKNVAKFINASSDKEIIFTKNATEAINLVAQTYANQIVSPGDEIMISALEHHSNIVPWQQLCKKRNVKLVIIPITKQGELDYQEFENIVSSKVKMIAVTQMSNVIGSTIDIIRIVKIAKKYGIKVLVDACQSIAHMKLDVKDLDCDFLVFSSHKLYGPTGVGVLYGKYKLLDDAYPFLTGGSMIKEVSFESTTFLNPPYKFEAGTPPIAEVIAFGEAINYLKSLDLEKVWDEERQITKYIKSEIAKLDNFEILASNCNLGIISIIHKKAHYSDIGEIMNKYGVAIRTGHHCAKPFMDSLEIPGTARISLGIYNNYEDAKNLIEALKKFNKLFA